MAKKFDPENPYDADTETVAIYLDACLREFNDRGRQLYDALKALGADIETDYAEAEGFLLELFGYE